MVAAEKPTLLTKWGSKSWGYFSSAHPIRIQCLRITKGGLDRAILAVVLINCLFIILQEENSDDQVHFNHCGNDGSSSWNCVSAVAEVIFTIIYTFEFFIKSIALGLYAEPTSYLRDYWNIMDVFVLVASYAGLVFMIFDVDQEAFRSGALVVFRMFRVLRAFRTVQKVSGLRVLVNSLIKAVPLLLRVVFMFTLLLVMFTILALNLFQGRLAMRCVPLELLPQDFSRGDPASTQDMVTDYVIDQVNVGQRNSFSGCSKQSECDEGWVCLKLENPYHEYLNFDDFGHSLVAIFQCITGEGWSDVMYRVWESTSGWSILFFVMVGVVGTNLIMNLLLAVIKESLSRVTTQMIKHNQENKLNALRLATITSNLNPVSVSQSTGDTPAHPMASFERTPSKRLKADQISIGTDGSITLKGSYAAGQILQNVKSGVNSTFTASKTLGKSSLVWVSKVFNQIALSKWFNLLSMFLVFVNTIFLSTTYSGMDMDLYKTLEVISNVLTVFFAVESTIKIIGFGPVKFAQSSFDVFDLVVAAIGLVEMIVASLNTGTEEGADDSRLKITAFRAVRVLRLGRVARILKLARYLDTIRAAGEVLRQSMKVFMYMVVLISLFVFIFSVVGMILFKDFYLDTAPEDLLSPRSNFKTFFNSILAVFQVLTLEGWTMLMWDAMKSSSVAGSIFYILWVIMGPYILLALLACGVLDNFEREYFEQRRIQKQQKKLEAARPSSPRTTLIPKAAKGIATGIKNALSSALGKGTASTNAVAPQDSTAPADEEELVGNGGLFGENYLPAAPDQPNSPGSPGRKSQDGTELGAGSPGKVPPGAVDLDAAESEPGRLSGDQDLFWQQQSAPLYKWRIPAQHIPEILEQLGRKLEPADYRRLGEQLNMRVEAAPRTPPVPSRPSSGNPRTPPTGGGGGGGGGTPEEGGLLRFGEGEDVFLELLVKYIVDAHNPKTPQNRHGTLLCTREAAVDLDLAFSCWSTYDQDSSGAINVREFQQVVGAFAKTARSQEQVQDVMMAVDIDGDGVVTFLEFLKAKNSILSESSVAQVLGIQQISSMRQVFDMFDEDGSGVIDRDELEKVMNMLGLNMTGWELSQLMLQMDYDDSGEINWYEFIRGMAKISQQGITDSEEKGDHDEGAAEKELEQLSKDTPEHEGRFTSVLSKGGGSAKRWVDAIAFGAQVTREDSLKFNESRPEVQKSKRQESQKRKRESKMLPLEGRSLAVLATDNPIRLLLHKLVSHPWFEWVILALIVLSSVVLALEGPRTSDKWKEVLTYVELTFTIIFTVEMIVKIVVLGLYQGPHAYLKSRWNQLDAVIVINSLISVILKYIVSMKGLSFLRTVRLVRALRPLRAVSRGSNLRVVVNTLLQSAIAIVNIAVMVLFAGYIFSILGLEFFAGGFHHCLGGGVFYAPEAPALSLDEATAAMAEPAWTRDLDWTVCALDWRHMESVEHIDLAGNYTCFYGREACEAAGNECEFVPAYEPRIQMNNVGFNTKDECEAMGYRWVDQIINFNDIGKVFISLFIVATGEGWVDFMHWSTDIGSRITGTNKVMPMNVSIDEGRTPAAALYYVLYISVTNFFLLRLFTGAVYTFYIQQRHDEESGFLTKSQRQWIEMQKYLHEELQRIQPPAQKFAWQRMVQRVLETDRCKFFFAATIVIQCLFMMTATVGMSTAHTRLLQGVTIVVTLLLLGEVMAKLSVYGLDKLKRDKWFAYDCLVLTLALLDMVVILIDLTRPEVFGSWRYREVSLVTLRLLRVGRYFRHTVQVSKAMMLVRTTKKLQIILETFLTSLPALLNMLIILLVFYFIFGVLGMNVFGHVSGDTSTGGVHEYVNFENFGMSILTLFRVSTGEDWQEVYHDLVWLQCDEKMRFFSPERCACGTTFVFFLSFFLVNVFIVMNLFVCIMIEIFAGVVSREYSDLAMEHVSDWVDIWSAECEFAEDGRSFMSPKAFKAFIRRVPEPLGVGQQASESATFQRIHDLRVSVDRGRIYFDTPLYQAVKRVAKALNPATRSTSTMHLSDEYIDTSYMGVLMEDFNRARARSFTEDGSEGPTEGHWARQDSDVGAGPSSSVRGLGGATPEVQDPQSSPTPTSSKVAFERTGATSSPGLIESFEGSPHAPLESLYSTPTGQWLQAGEDGAERSRRSRLGQQTGIAETGPDVMDIGLI